MVSVKETINKIAHSTLFKDSFWAVFGNGIGNGLLLLSGIIIARLLGKDVYGEYGLVKTTMFFMASFASLGLNYTSTKYIAESLVKNKALVKSHAQDALSITLVSSFVVATLLFVFAPNLALFLNDTDLKVAFQLLGCLIVLRTLSYTLAAILSGFGAFKTLARNNIISGVIMLTTCYPLTYYWGLAGAFGTLILFQLYNFISNYVSYRRQCSNLSQQKRERRKKDMILFSLPVAFQEISYTVCHWGGVLLITKLSTIGELGIYSATAQWNAVILFIPSMLSNVILSHLSGAKNKEQHVRIIKIVLFVNFICALIPFVIIYSLANIIVSFYGPTFVGMTSVLRVVTLSTVFICCAKVFYSEFISSGRTWMAFGARCVQDVSQIGLAYLLIKYCSNPASLSYAIAAVTASVLYMIALIILYKMNNNPVRKLETQKI